MMQVDFPLCLAPMVGLSHVALRSVIYDYLPADSKTIWPTEMLNSRRIPYEILSQVPEAMRAEHEDMMVPQILGNEEKPIAESVKKLQDWGAIGIDINMGCPVQKALKHNYGVALMGDSDYAAAVVDMTTRNTKLPVSVKLRGMGKETEDLNHLEAFTRKLIDAGATKICLHPRTKEQQRRGKADWSQIAYLKSKLGIEVIGNGDIQTVEDVFAMLTETNCNQVMSGRGLAARPWLMWQVGQRLGLKNPKGYEGRLAPSTPEEEAQEYGKCLIKLIDLSEFYFGESLALRKVRFYVRTTSVWIDFGQEVIGVCHKAQNCKELKSNIRELFEKPLRMCGRTELRQ
ncbi:MAG: tRNA dihydrouridine synthase [Pseudobdellovibrionaceae bacterium]